MIPVKYKFPHTSVHEEAEPYYYDIPVEVEEHFRYMNQDEQDKYRRVITDSLLPVNLACRPLAGEVILSTNQKFSVTVRKVRHMEQDGHPCLLLDVY